jgi:large subunit ribosomal protein L15
MRKLQHGEAGLAFPTSTMRTFSLNTEPAVEQAKEPASQEANEQNLPRWAYTPKAMKAPFSPHVTKDPSRSIWKVNTDPDKLDQMYEKLLGRDGANMLPDEIKWLAVTHKSFDQGRRGFNDRLAYLGECFPAF